MIPHAFKISLIAIAFSMLSCCDDEVPLQNCPCFNDPQYPIYKACEESVVYTSADACESVEGLYKDLSAVIRYPEEARENGIAGTVVVAFDIQTDGHMTNIIAVNDTLGYGLAEAAVKAVNTFNKKGWCPARRDCEPVVYHYHFPVKFVLPPG
jgi:TonB family protein